MNVVRIFIATVAGVVLAATGSVIAVSASASTSGGIVPGSVRITHDPPGDETTQLRVGDSVQVSAAWAVPDGAAAGDTFTLGLPDLFSAVSVAPFALVTASGETMGECVVTGKPAVVRCTLNAAVEGRQGVHGTLWAKVRASKDTLEDALPFVLGPGVEAMVELPGHGGILAREVGPDPGPTSTAPAITALAKHGANFLASGEGLWWMVSVPSAAWGAAGSDPVTVVDRTGEGAEHRFLDLADYPKPNGRPYVEQVCDDDPERYPRVVDDASLARWEISPDGRTLTVELDRRLARKAGVDGLCGIRINYVTRPLGEVRAGDTFRNGVAVGTGLASGRIVIAGSGGGTSEGDQVGRFSLAKSVAGTARAAIDSATVFHVGYSASGYPDGTLDVTADGVPVSSPWFRAGTRVVLWEIDPPVIDGVRWGAPVFAADGLEAGEELTVVVASDGELPVTVTNFAEPTVPATEVPDDPEPEEEVPGDPEPETPVTPEPASPGIALPTPGGPTPSQPAEGGITPGPDRAGADVPAGLASTGADLAIPSLVGIGIGAVIAGAVAVTAVHRRRRGATRR